MKFQLDGILQCSSIRRSRTLSPEWAVFGGKSLEKHLRADVDQMSDDSCMAPQWTGREAS